MSKYVRLTGGACAIEGCSEPIHGYGVCVDHYPIRSNDPSKTDAERFLLKIDKNGPDGCWSWMGVKNDKGYGQLTHQGGSRRSIYAHRVSYEHFVGPIPEGCVVDHLCFNPACVNPEHLRAVTAKQNMEHRQGASRISKTGVRGVYPTAAGKFQAQASRHHIGTFDNIEEAAAAVREARLRIMTHSDADRTLR